MYKGSIVYSQILQLIIISTISVMFKYQGITNKSDFKSILWFVGSLLAS